MRLHERRRVHDLEAQFVESNPSVQSFLKEKARKSQLTARMYSHFLFHYWLWLNEKKGFKDMQSVLNDFKQKKKTEEEYSHNDIAKEYLLEEKKLKSLSFRKQALATIRGWYRHNRCPLPQEKIDLTVSETDDYIAREKLGLRPMTLRDVEKLLAPMKIREKAMMLILLQSGMGVGEFCYQFNVCNCRNEWLKNGNGHVCEPAKVMKQINEGKLPVKIAFTKRKKNKHSYFTFIGRDAVELLKEYLVFRATIIRNAQKREADTHGLTPEWRDGQPLFISDRLNPMRPKNIEFAVQRYKIRMGLANKQFTPHTFRDIFKTECSHAGVDDAISEFFMGHTLDTLGYNKLDKMYPEVLEKEYEKVEPALNIFSQTHVVRKDQAKEVFLELIDEMMKDPEKKQVFQKYFVEAIQKTDEDVLGENLCPNCGRKLVLVQTGELYCAICELRMKPSLTATKP